MVKEIISDIFTAPIDGLAQSCNCQNNWGSGLVIPIKQRYPEAYEADQKTVKGDKEKLGSFSYAKVKDLDGQLQHVFNCYGQFTYGSSRHTNYEAIYTSLESVRDFIEENDFKSYDNKKNYTLGIPFKLGSDRGGANWSVIKQMIYSIFKNSLIDVLICIHPNYLPSDYTLNRFLHE